MYAGLLFKHPWREYQRRILDQLPLYREDRKVHIVAPPGAGKTVLGLEVILRIGKQALVLAPSLTIRAQWAERLKKDFNLADDAEHELISHDLENPASITIVTYQALYFYLKREATETLNWAEVLVVDECHHLRREWWKSLSNLCKVTEPELVALTATPPYDVSGLEWRRYHDFCGEIDEEISIPELVAAGDLCHHQDYIYPVLPAAELLNESRAFADKKIELYKLLAEQRPLALAILSHPWLCDPEEHYAAIFAEPEYFSALLVVLKYLGSEPPVSALGILHGESTIAPELTDEWLTIFLQKALRKDDYFKQTIPIDSLKLIRRHVSTMRAWEKGKLHLDEPVELGKKIRNNTGKLRAVSEIIRHEWEDIGNELRSVVLTDFIYPELLPTTEYDRPDLTKVGVSSLFEQLRRDGLADDNPTTLPVATNRLAILTGTLVVIPQSAENRLLELAYDQLPTERVIKTEPLFPNSNYVVLNAGTLSSKYLVAWVTELFTEGEVNVIIGTKSLLGEGWDAPAINSLILASTVGSFVLSNQMRGRAIRTNKGEPNKTANIWHPVTYNPGLPNGGSDMVGLQRRFRAFAGPKLYGEPIIMNGLGRYDFNWSDANFMAIEEFGIATLRSALNRSGLKERWSLALEKGTHLVEAIEPPGEQYYREKDKLSRYYFERADQLQQSEVEQYQRNWMLALFLPFAITSLILYSVKSTELIIYLTVPAFCYFSYQLLQRLSSLKIVRMRLGLPPLEARVVNPIYLFIPVVISLFFVIASWVGPFVYLALGAIMIRLLVPQSDSNEMAKRFEFIANPRQRILSYGTALVQSLIDAGRLRQTSPEQFTVETDDEGHYLAYLTEADHHDTHFFAESLDELMQPIDNPRYLLRIEHPAGWSQGEYYLPVPTALGRKRAEAERLRIELEAAINCRLELIHTRNPAGRLHLLTAKLQLSSNEQDEQARRDVLWR